MILSSKDAYFLYTEGEAARQVHWEYRVLIIVVANSDDKINCGLKHAHVPHTLYLALASKHFF